MAVLGGIDGLVLTAGIGENSVEIRRRIIRASAWAGDRTGRRCQCQGRSPHLDPRQQSLGMGDSDQ